jgi:hypothetical protein
MGARVSHDHDDSLEVSIPSHFPSCWWVALVGPALVCALHLELGLHVYSDVRNGSSAAAYPVAGGDVPAIANYLDKSWTEARTLMNAYDKAYPCLKTAQEDAQVKAVTQVCFVRGR